MGQRVKVVVAWFLWFMTMGYMARIVDRAGLTGVWLLIVVVALALLMASPIAYFSSYNPRSVGWVTRVLGTVSGIAGLFGGFVAYDSSVPGAVVGVGAPVAWMLFAQAAPTVQETVPWGREGREPSDSEE